MGSTRSASSGDDARGRGEGGPSRRPSTSLPRSLAWSPRRSTRRARAATPDAQRRGGARRARRRARARALAGAAERRRRDLRRRPRRTRLPRACERPPSRSTRARRRTCSSAIVARTRSSATADEPYGSTIWSAPRASGSRRRKRERPLAELERAVAARERGPPVPRGAVAPRHVADRRVQAPLALGGHDPRGRDRHRGRAAPTSAAAPPRCRCSPRRTTSAVRSTTCTRRARPRDLPILRKDFTVDPYQLYEARRPARTPCCWWSASLTDAELERALRRGPGARPRRARRGPRRGGAGARARARRRRDRHQQPRPRRTSRVDL